MWAGGQERARKNHAATENTQAQFETVVGQLFGSTITLIGFWFEVMVVVTARESANRKGHGINKLNSISSLSAEKGQTVLNVNFDRPKAYGLPQGG